MKEKTQYFCIYRVEWLHNWQIHSGKGHESIISFNVPFFSLVIEATCLTHIHIRAGEVTDTICRQGRNVYISKPALIMLYINDIKHYQSRLPCVTQVVRFRQPASKLHAGGASPWYLNLQLTQTTQQHNTYPGCLCLIGDTWMRSTNALFQIASLWGCICYNQVLL